MACDGAEYHGGGDTVQQKCPPHGSQEVQRWAWTSQHVAWPNKCVFHCLTTLPKELTSRAALPVTGKGNCQEDSYLSHHLLSVTFLQVYKGQECLLTPGCHTIKRVDNQENRWPSCVHVTRAKVDSSEIPHVLHSITSEEMEQGCHLWSEACAQQALLFLSVSMAPEGAWGCACQWFYIAGSCCCSNPWLKTAIPVP